MTLRCFVLFFVGLLPTAVAANADEPPTQTLVITGQAAGQADGAMLLFGEVRDASGRQLGSYFERFTPTQVDPETKAPLAGNGQGMFRLAGGTLATKYSSKVVGPGTQPNSIRVESSGNVVQATGDYGDLSGGFTSVGIVSQTMSFETTVRFSVTGGRALAPPPQSQTPPVTQAGGTFRSGCSGSVAPAVYVCPPARRTGCCTPRSRGLSSLFGCFGG